ncbi:hypothetical protein KIL84_012126 [Mauremys mutica]|uniref:Uncharacterized protein n=1 Tax=Mauremys mutica TaxID=74926 RepID=A0A9D4B2Q4_9SAUR|nr:hypothetical protein KIL84_012126 [Mauremys mutica]
MCTRTRREGLLDQAASETHRARCRWVTPPGQNVAPQLVKGSVGANRGADKISGIVSQPRRRSQRGGVIPPPPPEPASPGLRRRHAAKLSQRGQGVGTLPPSRP